MDTLKNDKSEERNCKRPRVESENDETFQIPVLSGDAPTSRIQEAYLESQALHISKISTTNSNNTPLLTWKDLKSVFESLNDQDKESWCIENGGVDTSPSDFLEAHTTGYSSFLIQHSSQILQDTLEKFPISTLVDTWKHGLCCWCFFGVNRSSISELQGRPEHTDSVSHDGTWHYQLSGQKQWHLRPTEELLQTCPQAAATMVHVKQGDVIIVNTRLWWHQTVIPPQPTPSVSYARDFYIESDIPRESEEPMKNVDGMYAANDMEEGTIIFTENDLPDCQLPHVLSQNANAKVVELQDGSSALVSTRYIHAGEFFCVAEEESDSDEADECSEEEQFESEADVSGDESS